MDAMKRDLRFYEHGAEIHEITAKQLFRCFNTPAAELSEIDAMWAQCLVSEEARDEWFPASLEMVDEGQYA